MIAPLLCVPLWLTALVVEERQAQAAPAGGAPADKQAREHFQNAENSFNLGRFPDALADYQAAYEAKPLPGFLFNIAQCYRNMQSYDRARFFYRRYLALDPKTPNRRLVEDLIAEMTRELDKAEKAAEAEKADKAEKTEQTDDHATPPVDVAVTVTPSAPVLTSPPPPPPAPAPAPAPALALASHAPAPAESPPIYKRWWFWTGAGAVVAAGVILAIFALRPADPQGSLGTINGKQ